MRGSYAGIGYTMMALSVGSTDVFISQQPYASWTIILSAAQWEAPILVYSTYYQIADSYFPEQITINQTQQQHGF